MLEGVTRDAVLDLGRVAGHPHVPRAYPLAEVAEADEVFLTSSVRGVIPVASIDGVAPRLAPGPVTEELLVRYDELASATAVDAR